MSSKCADINAEMTRLMGVTEPLLNLVVFCHQEDSNWPLDESSKVKEKFDAIFAAQKYNECLKEIKNCRLAEMAKVKENNKDLEHYAEYKKMAQDKERNLLSLNQDKDQLQEDISDREEQLKPLKQKQKEIDQIATGFSDIQNKLTEGEKINGVRYLLKNLHNPDLIMCF